MNEDGRQRLWTLAATVLALGSALALPQPLAAQGTMTETDQMLMELIQEQQRQIEALQRELEALRAGRPTDEALAPEPEPVQQAESPSPRAPVPVLEPEAEPARPARTGITLSVSGQINQAINVADDGDTTKAYFVDNDTSNSRIRIEADATQSVRNVGGVLEMAFSPNNSYDVDQDNEAADDDFIQVRRAEVYLRNDARGKLSFGQGSAAADDTAEYDLSLVAGPIMYSGVADIVGGLQFTDGDNLTGITVGDAFFNFDGDRFGRLRYDTPMVGPFQLSLSAGSDQRYDAALTFGGDYGDWSGVELGDFSTLGAVAIRDPSDDAFDWVATGSFSALHNPTGLSVTVSGGYGGGAAGDEPFNLYGKLGWDTQFNALGMTGFGIDATYAENVNDEGDEGQSFGVAVVQLIEQFGVELYGQARLYSLDRDQAPSVDDIVVGTVGTRIKF
jgi:hypothetical protein